MAYAKKWARKMDRDNRCVNCGKPRDRRGAYCVKCLANYNMRQRERRAEGGPAQRGEPN